MYLTRWAFVALFIVGVFVSTHIVASDAMRGLVLAAFIAAGVGISQISARKVDEKRRR